jgi:branched-chain amino acid transport system ATP-binding protein
MTERAIVSLLQVNNLSKRFGGLTAVDEVSFKVNEGMIFGVIGPNGAGKTTLYNLITGVHKPDSGTVVFDGEDVTKVSTHDRAARGLARTFQQISLFSDLTVFENVSVAHHLSRRRSQIGQLLATKKFRHEERDIKTSIQELLSLLGLLNVQYENAKSLSHGYQRALGIAIALSARPRLLLLDEPVTGLNEKETAEMMAKIRMVRSEMGVTVVLIEHVMKAMMGLSENIIVLNTGRKIAEGTPIEIANNPDVIEAYLGQQEGV